MHLGSQVVGLIPSLTGGGRISFSENLLYFPTHCSTELAVLKFLSIERAFQSFRYIDSMNGWENHMADLKSTRLGT